MVKGMIEHPNISDVCFDGEIAQCLACYSEEECASTDISWEQCNHPMVSTTMLFPVHNLFSYT